LLLKILLLPPARPPRSRFFGVFPPFGSPSFAFGFEPGKRGGETCSPKPTAAENARPGAPSLPAFLTKRPYRPLYGGCPSATNRGPFPFLRNASRERGPPLFQGWVDFRPRGPLPPTPGAPDSFILNAVQFFFWQFPVPTSNAPFFFAFCPPPPAPQKFCFFAPPIVFVFCQKQPNKPPVICVSRTPRPGGVGCPPTFFYVWVAHPSLCPKCLMAPV